MKGEPGGRERALAGLAASRTTVPEGDESAVAVGEGDGVSVVVVEKSEGDWDSELRCVMGPPGKRMPNFLQYSPMGW